jgi:energy-coupling factor transporter ATP-binding protein EcfA2
MNNPFVKAERKAAKIKLAITGPSGSGKTTAALKLARGLVGPSGKIAVIDTENQSASLYSDITSFDVLNLEAPFEHKKFTESIQAAEANGYDAVIIDSASHLWEAILDYKTKLDRRGGNSYTNWSDAGGKFKEVIDCLLGSRLHVISCLRSKMEHAIEKDDRGKTTIRKVGMAPIMRDGIEYEFTVVLDLDMQHQAVSSKDRTRMFDGKIIEVTEDVGKQLATWLAGATPEDVGERKITVSELIKPAPEPEVKPEVNLVDDDVPYHHVSDIGAKIDSVEMEEAVNAYLIKLKWINAGQNYKHLAQPYVEKVLTRWDSFLIAAQKGSQK